MQLVRFIVTAAFAWMLVRATFANTVAWRHPQTLGTSGHHQLAKKSLAAQPAVYSHRT